MPYIHEFGIIDCIEENKDYEYNPKEYNCISVSGDLIDRMWNSGFREKMKAVKTYAHNTNRPYKDLAYYGVTLIPPKYLKNFLEIIIEENKLYNSYELDRLIKKISQGIRENKWLIHYGI